MSEEKEGVGIEVKVSMHRAKVIKDGIGILEASDKLLESKGAEPEDHLRTTYRGMKELLEEIQAGFDEKLKSGIQSVFEALIDSTKAEDQRIAELEKGA